MHAAETIKRIPSNKDSRKSNNTIMKTKKQ